MSDIVINFESYHAVIRSNGAGLSVLKYQNRDLVEPFQNVQPTKYQGDVLAPWPNRIKDGKYSYKGKNYQAPVNEKSRNNALHGLVNNVPWEVKDVSTSHVRLNTVLKSSDAYPGELDLEILYSLDHQGLKIEIKSTNVGSNSVPYGVSIHPYLIADSSTKVDEWILKIKSHKYFRVDSERLLPISIESIPKEFDFREGMRISNTFIDHAFLLEFEGNPSEISLTSANGQGVLMRHSENLTWVQIHTADRDGGADSRRCLAVEPMTCPPDAFNSGIDVVELNPGDVHRSHWLISAI